MLVQNWNMHQSQDIEIIGRYILVWMDSKDYELYISSKYIISHSADQLGEAY